MALAVLSLSAAPVHAASAAEIDIGSEYGEGALQVSGKTVGYYSTAEASIGFQLSAQARPGQAHYRPVHG